MKSIDKGFTLVELMVAMTIIGVLLAIAAPSFFEYLAKSKRADATGVLSETATFMERNFAASGRYDLTEAGAAIVLPLALTTAPRGSASAYYNISFQGAVGESTFIVQAIPVNSMDGDACGTLTINQRGQKGVSGSRPVAECWQ